MPPYRAAFILAPHRSGSTLLDNLLASHQDVVTLGEVHNLRAYALEDRRYYDPKQPLICSCGSTVPDCGFWQRVQEAVGVPLGGLSLRWPPTSYERHSLSALRRTSLSIGLRALASKPGLFRSSDFQQLLGCKSVVDDNWRVFDAVHSVNGAACIVDASKAAYRFRALWQSKHRPVCAIVLCRDYRAVTHSLMRRGLSIEDAISQWRRSLELIEEMIRELPEKNVYRLTYEDMCADPQLTIKRVWQFLGLPETSNAVTRSVAELHHISGSPSKFDPERQVVRFDDSFLGIFDRAQLEYLRVAAEPYARSWGYE